MKVITTVVGSLQTNCYLLIDEETKLAALIDPGDEAERLLALVKDGKELSEEDIIKLWQVKLGAPKNRILRQLMEHGDVRKKLDKIDMEMAADFRKEERFRRKRVFTLMIRYLCPLFAAIILVSSVANAFGWIRM